MSIRFNGYVVSKKIMDAPSVDHLFRKCELEKPSSFSGQPRCKLTRSKSSSQKSAISRSDSKKSATKITTSKTLQTEYLKPEWNQYLTDDSKYKLNEMKLIERKTLFISQSRGIKHDISDRKLKPPKPLTKSFATTAAERNSADVMGATIAMRSNMSFCIDNFSSGHSHGVHGPEDVLLKHETVDDAPPVNFEREFVFPREGPMSTFHEFEFIDQERLPSDDETFTPVATMMPSKPANGYVVVTRIILGKWYAPSTPREQSMFSQN
jgi:hypothetical protein